MVKNFITRFLKNLDFKVVSDLKACLNNCDKKIWPSPTGIWTPDFWTSSCPQFEFWGRLELTVIKYLDFTWVRWQQRTFQCRWENFGIQQKSHRPLHRLFCQQRRKLAKCSLSFPEGLVGHLAKMTRKSPIWWWKTSKRGQTVSAVLGWQSRTEIARRGPKKSIHCRSVSHRGSPEIV